MSAEQLIALIDIAINYLTVIRSFPVSDSVGYIEAVTVPLESKKIVVGDLHGDITSIEENLEDMHQENFFVSNDRQNEMYDMLKPDHILIGTGDNGDRGYHSVEVWQRLLRIFIRNPYQVFLVRGNHETAQLAQSSGDEFSFMDELKCKFPAENVATIFEHFKSLWEQLPSLLAIGAKDEEKGEVSFMIAVHGSLEPSLIERCNELLARATASATRAIVAIPYRADDMQTIDSSVATIYGGAPTITENGHLWGDVNPRGVPHVRGRALQLYSLDIDDYLPRLSGSVGRWRWRTVCVSRGHQHNDGGVLINTAHGFLPLLAGIARDICVGDVFTFISSPEGLGYYKDAYGVIQSHAGRPWTITPRVHEADTFWGCSRCEDANKKLQCAVINRIFHNCTRLMEYEGEPKIKLIASGLLDSAKDDQIPVQQLIYDGDPDAAHFWQLMRQRISTVPPFWRSLLNQELDHWLLESQAKNLLRSIADSGKMMLENTALAQQAQDIEYFFYRTPHGTLEEVVDQHRTSAALFWRSVADQLRSYESGAADRLRQLLPPECKESLP